MNTAAGAILPLFLCDFDFIFRGNKSLSELLFGGSIVNFLILFFTFEYRFDRI